MAKQKLRRNNASARSLRQRKIGTHDLERVVTEPSRSACAAHLEEGAALHGPAVVALKAAAADRILRRLCGLQRDEHPARRVGQPPAHLKGVLRDVAKAELTLRGNALTVFQQIIIREL